MRSSKFAVHAAVLGALSLPFAFTSQAHAAPAAAPTVASDYCHRTGPWVIDASAVTIRSRATSNSTAVGILYRGHKFTVHKSSGGWRYITDRTTGVTGWVSGTYVYNEVYVCLD
ncbi:MULTISPECIES: SH3 domain-containing protein [Streptomyces]|uniref:SH3 domain-containing protein n=1 Tax=Streptomyces TaxID=1883 RepID=UPI00163BD98A|nr:MULTISPECIES: SH3 domain-containing protein [Streptomyces]MBC2878082.1 SH3 domain-containing protein [Streptomyces sp. TYQ1024]UBI40030.1 SH3 domain-containing protein [Streptomyces mobaraensis]UKW32610.1 SH3 domain-containing protein [Streptomyces sp. TYQ1024]